MKEDNILIQAGLSEDQAQIYEALLEKGPQKASALASWTGIKRGLTYKVLEQLELMGLVEKKDGTGTIATFIPLHPSLLMNNLERKEKELSMAKEMLTYSLGQLASKYNLITGKPNVQFFEGKEAIQIITSDLPNTDTLIRQCIDISRAIDYFPEETLSYIKKRVAKNISKKMIVPASESNKKYVEKGSPLTEFRFLTETTFPTSIQVYDERVTLLTLTQEKQIGLIIEDKSIADTFKILFDSLWNTSIPSFVSQSEVQ